MKISHITLFSKLSLLKKIYIGFATDDKIVRREISEPWFIRIDKIYYTEAPVTVENLMLNLRLTHEFGLAVPKEYQVIDLAIDTLASSPEVWDAGLAKYGENTEVVRLINQLFQFIPELERAIVNIVGETL